MNAMRGCSLPKALLLAVGIVMLMPPGSVQLS